MERTITYSFAREGSKMVILLSVALMLGVIVALYDSDSQYKKVYERFLTVVLDTCILIILVRILAACFGVIV